MVSRALIRAELSRAHHRSLLRVSLHPQDVQCAEVLAHWRTLIADVLAERTPVTKEQWTASLNASQYEYPATAGRASTSVAA
jgi:hypothetical protein